MISQLSFAVALAVITASCAQASLEEYVESFATGKEGLQQRCFLQYILWDANDRYKGESITDEFDDELTDIRNYLADELENRPQNGYCLQFSECRDVGRFSIEREFTGQSLADAQCYRWSKFERLCKLIRDRSYTDRQLLAVEGWVCQVSAEQKMPQIREYDNICRRVVREAAQEQAQKDFYDVVSYSEEKLEKEKQALNEEVAAENQLKAAHDAEIAKEANQLIRERMEKHLDDFKGCWSKLESERDNRYEEARKARQVEWAARKAATDAALEAKKKKGFFGSKLFKCSNKSCA